LIPIKYTCQRRILSSIKCSGKIE